MTKLLAGVEELPAQSSGTELFVSKGHLRLLFKRGRVAIESQQELGERFWRELRELVDLGEVSPAFSERVIEDMFEPAPAGQIPPLRWSVWRAYVEELTGGIS